MTTALQHRRGTATQNDAFTGLSGEITVDTTNNTLRVHDGATAGGTKLAKASDITAAVRYDTASQGLTTAQQSNARANINAIAAPASNGMVAQTAAGTVTARTITAGTGISVTNGDGISGDPTITNTGVTSIGGATGAITVGSGLSLSSGTLSASAPANYYIGGRGQVFTASGTFTVPTGVTAVKVTVVAGGGGGGGTNTAAPLRGGGGGGGGTAIKYITGLTPEGTVSVTVGGGGSGGKGGVGVSGANGTSGASSSFGAYCSATGGAFGYGSDVGNMPTYGGAAGTGSSGDLNIRGWSGMAGNSADTGVVPTGGQSAIGVPGNGAIASTQGTAAGVYGGGGLGGGGGVTTGAGGAGGAGVVIVEW